MKCKRTIDWIRYTLEFERHEMQAIITWLGWSAVDTFSEMTEKDKAELYRLEFEIKGVWARNNPFPEHKDWFMSHVIHQENMHGNYADMKSRCVLCESEETTDLESPICADCLVETLDMRLGE